MKPTANTPALLVNHNGVSGTGENDGARQPRRTGANNLNRFRSINLPGLCASAHHRFGRLPSSAVIVLELQHDGLRARALNLQPDRVEVGRQVEVGTVGYGIGDFHGFERLLGP